MSDIVLQADGLSKVFRRYKSEFQRVLSLLSINVPVVEEKWVLKDISFALAKGEALAIVGRNGAGKSTLLKLITGTMRASEGEMHLVGRISAILELGMGFNPEFTGRANVFHALGLMGFQHEEIAGVIDQVEAFSELGDYFDQPIRVYSSGMHMRLAFSVATAFRPDILIVDEALSVGDAYFQHKSFEQIRRFRNEGTSLILVSHDRMALLSLCDRALLLHEGRVALDGEPEGVLDYYNALLGQQDETEIQTKLLGDGRVQTRSGTREATIDQTFLTNAKGENVESVSVGDEVEIHVHGTAHKALDQLVLGYSIKDRFGQILFGTNTFYSGQPLKDLKEGEKFSFTVKFNANFGEGNYSVALALVDGENHMGANYEWIDLAIIFDVSNFDKQTFDGKLYIPTVIEAQRH